MVIEKSVQVEVAFRRAPQEPRKRPQSAYWFSRHAVYNHPVLSYPNRPATMRAPAFEIGHVDSL